MSWPISGTGSAPHEGSLGLTGEALAAHEEALKSLGEPCEGLTGIRRNRRFPARARRQPTRRSATSRQKPGRPPRPCKPTGKRFPSGESWRARTRRLRTTSVTSREPGWSRRRCKTRPEIWPVHSVRHVRSSSGKACWWRWLPVRRSMPASWASTRAILPARCRRSKQPAEALAVYRQATESLGQLPPQTSGDFQELAFWHAACRSPHRQPRGQTERGGSSAQEPRGRPGAGESCQGSRCRVQRHRPHQEEPRLRAPEREAGIQEASRRSREEAQGPGLEPRPRSRQGPGRKGEEGLVPLLRGVGLVPLRQCHEEVAPLHRRVPRLRDTAFRDRRVR